MQQIYIDHPNNWTILLLWAFDDCFLSWPYSRSSDAAKITSISNRVEDPHTWRSKAF